MTEEIGLHLQRASQDVEDAQLLLDAGRYVTSVGRSYYAMFHAATAALLEKGIQRSSHQGIISAFGRFIVKTGLIEQEFHRHFREAFDLRQASDYEPTVQIDAGQAEQTLNRAKEFVAACRQLCS